MAKSVTPGIIDMQVTDINLSGGLDARTRKESVDWTRFWTTLENVVNENGDCYVKRSGVANLLGTTVDSAGASYLPLLRAVKTQGPPAFIGNGKLYVGNTQTTGYESAGKVADLSVAELYTLASSSTGVASTGVGMAFFVGTAASTKYVCAMWNIAVSGGSGYEPMLYVLDRQTGATVRAYRLTDAGISSIQGRALVMVDDRYLHVYSDRATVNGYFIQIDTNSLPQSLSGAAVVNLTGWSATAIVRGAVAYSGGSAVVTGRSGTADIVVEKFNTSGAAVANATYAATLLPTSHCVATNGTSLYVAGTDSPLTGVKVLVITISSLAVSATILDTSLYYSALSPTPLIAVDQTGNIALAVNRGDADGNPFTDIYYRASGAGAYTFIEKISGSIPLALFYLNSTSTFYAHIQTQITSRSAAGASVLSTSVRNYIVDISTAMGTHVRPVAAIDEMVSSLGSSYAIGMSSNDVFPSYYVRTSLEAQGVRVAHLRKATPDMMSSSAGAIGGGMVSHYDGSSVFEHGICSTPCITVADSGGGSGPGAGLYNYIALFESTDASGLAHYSAMGTPTALTMATGNAISVKVSWPSIFGRSPRPSNVVARIYRTTNGGTIYRLVGTAIGRDGTASGTALTGRWFATLTDSVTDATLTSASQPYRQPGSLGTALDRTAPTAAMALVRHKDRLFYAYGSTVYYSSFYVTGEAPWFNAQFSFQVPGGTGRIMALASMDGQLVIFKRDAIFIVDGDGPPENGGTGTEFGAPRQILTEFGCVDPRSVVNTPDGIMFRSQRGIEILSRAMQVAWIGELAQDVVNNHPYITGAAYDLNRGIVMFCLATAESSAGIADASQPGVVLAYNTANRTWAVYKYGDGNAVQDVGFARYNSASGSPNRRYFILKTNGGASGVMWDAWSTSLDYSNIGTPTWVTMKLESGWIKSQSKQDRIKVSEILLLAKNISNHEITISVAYDYSDAYTHSVTFRPNEINNMDLEQLLFNVPDGAKQAVRFKIEDSAPSDTVVYPVGTNGSGCEILGVSVKIGKRGGGAKLPDMQRG